MTRKRYAIKLSPELLKAAKQSTDLKSDGEVVTFALEEVIRIKRQQLAIRSMFENDWARDLNDPAVKAEARS